LLSSLGVDGVPARSTRMHVVQLLAPQLDYEDHTKDVDFGPAGIKRCWDEGYALTKAVLAREPWVGQFDPQSGVILHEGRRVQGARCRVIPDAYRQQNLLAHACSSPIAVQ
jgi:hypothetical protein